MIILIVELLNKNDLNFEKILLILLTPKLLISELRLLFGFKEDVKLSDILYILIYSDIIITYN